MIAVEEPFTNPAIAPLPAMKSAPETPLYEAALLIDLIGGGAPQPAPSTNWNLLRHIATENGVLAHAFQSLVASGTSIPDSFAKSARDSEAANMRLAMELHSLLALFARHNIDVLPLKGPALSLALYGDASMRSSNDLDLLVRRKDFSRAEALLVSQSFLPAGPLAGYHKPFSRGALLVELHLDLSEKCYLPLDMESIWSRAQTTEFCGQPTCVMSREDLALYLCCHGSKHRFSRLIWTLDFAQSIQGWSTSEYESLLSLAERHDLAPWLFLACAVLRAIFPHRLPDALDAILSSSAINKRAECTVARMFSGDAKTGINDYRGLYLQIEPSPWKRLRYIAGYFALSPYDRKWASSHHIPTALMFALRPFRIIERHGIRRAFHTFFPQK